MAFIFVKLSTYYLDFLTKMNMVRFKPCDANFKLSSIDGEIFADLTEYRSLVSGLQYLTWKILYL